MSQSPEPTDVDRRRYPRLKRPVFYRLPSFFDRWTSVRDVSVGGCRIYCDEELELGARLVLEVLLPDGTTVESRASVVWSARSPEAAPAEWEVGLRFHSVAKRGAAKLIAYLESPEEEAAAAR